MHMTIQNRSVLYAEVEPVLVPEAVYEADLVDVRRFSNAFGNGSAWCSDCAGADLGIELMEVAALEGIAHAGSWPSCCAAWAALMVRC